MFFKTSMLYMDCCTSSFDEGGVSISQKPSYPRISSSLEAALNFCMRFGSIAAEPLAKFQSDIAILNMNLVASRLDEILG